MPLEAGNGLAVLSRVMQPNALLRPASPSFSLVGRPPAAILPKNAGETFRLGINLTLLPNGNILALYSSAAGGNSGNVLCMQQSSNGGVSWTPYAGTTQGGGTNPNNCEGLFYSALPTYNSRNNSTMLTTAGSIIIFWGVDDGNLTWNGYYSRSTDNGVTWSAAAALPAGYGTPTNGNTCVIPGGGVCPAYPSGALLTTCEQTTPSQNPVACLISTNDGQSWSVLSTIGNYDEEEVNITWVGANTLIGFVRTANTPILLIWSLDCGNTWNSATTNLTFSQPQPSGSTGLASYTEISPWLINDNPGIDKVTLLWGERGVWNGWSVGPSNVNTLAYFRSVTFDPIAVISNPLSFGPGQLLASDIGGLYTEGYPSACPVSAASRTYLLGWMQSSPLYAPNDTDLFLFNAAYQPGKVPTTATSITPAIGSTSGGTSISIYGEGFTAGATVTIGGAPATSVSVVGSGYITCVTPSGAAGTANVVVTCNGQSSTIVNGFTYGSLSPAFVSSGASTSTVAPVTLNTTGATLLIAVISSATTTATPSTISDSVGGQSNAWNYLTEQLSTAGGGYTNHTRIAYAYAATGGGALHTGASHVFTPAGQVSASCVIYAFSATLTTSAVFDKQSGAANQAGTTSQSYTLQAGSITPTAGALVIMGCGNNGTTFTSDTIPTGFTGEQKQTNGTNFEIVAGCYKLNDAGSAENPSWTVTLNNFTGVVIASFI